MRPGLPRIIPAACRRRRPANGACVTAAWHLP